MFEHPGIARLRARRAHAVAVADALRDQMAEDCAILEHQTRVVEAGVSYAVRVGRFVYRNRFVVVAAVGVLIASRIRGAVKVFQLGSLWGLASWGKKLFGAWQTVQRIRSTVGQVQTAMRVVSALRGGYRGA